MFYGGGGGVAVVLVVLGPSSRQVVLSVLPVVARVAVPLGSPVFRTKAAAVAAHVHPLPGTAVPVL